MSEKTEKDDFIPDARRSRKMTGTGPDGPVRMKKEVGPMAATMIILGAIIGSGIYVSPTGILMNAETPGFSMILWVLGGIVAGCGALCYAEVGLLIPKSGGEYPIVYDTYGHVPAFLFAWASSTIIRPCGFAICCATFSKYLLSVLKLCDDQIFAERLLSVWAIWAVVLLNCYSMKLTNMITKLFGYLKLSSLAFVVLLGVYGLILKKGDLSIWRPENSFSKDGEFFMPSPENIGLGLYSGLWSYDGWNQLNYVLEEVKNPEKNLLKAIISSLVLISGFYLIINFFYISMLGPAGILASEAVATSYAMKIMPRVGWVIPILVACSSLGTALVAAMTSSRVPYVAARQNQFPRFLSMIHVSFLTPVPAVILNGLVATLAVMQSNLNQLINYFSFAMWIFHTMTCLAVIVLRKLKPIDRYPRTFTVPLPIPIIMSIIGPYLVMVPFIKEFKKIGKEGEVFDYGYAFVFLWLFFGLGMYLMVKKWSGSKLNYHIANLTRRLQLFFQVLPEE